MVSYAHYYLSLKGRGVSQPIGRDRLGRCRGASRERCPVEIGVRGVAWRLVQNMEVCLQPDPEAPARLAGREPGACGALSILPLLAISSFP